MKSVAVSAVLLLAAVAGPAIAADEPAPVPAPADWGQALAEDARAFHAVIRDSHPGPVDAENPGFNALLDGQLALALERAGTADSYEDWYFALQAFQAAFDDGHLRLGAWAPMGHAWRMRWPGFLTGLRSGPEGDRHVVVFSPAGDGPPVGAELIGCDGRPAQALAAERVGRFVGRWSLRARRMAYAATLFVDQGNPYVPTPARCDFTVGGQPRTWDLAWRDLTDAERDAGFAAASSPRFAAPIELAERDGTAWIGLGSFATDPASPDGQALARLVEAVGARAAALRVADRVVFDLRGNGGGSSGWSVQLARALWGEDRADAFAPRSAGVDWRASPGNLAQIELYRDELFADHAEARAWAATIAEGLSAALAAGQPLWRQSGGEPYEGEPGPSPVRGRVYVLTDYGCASACLDAVDLFTALGAVHVGQETSADTVYMDTRDETLPGGRVAAVIPMKVYRGRARGHNEPLVPAHAWTGELSDTDGIAAWIRQLESGS